MTEEEYWQMKGEITDDYRWSLRNQMRALGVSSLAAAPGLDGLVAWRRGGDKGPAEEEADEAGEEGRRERSAPRRSRPRSRPRSYGICCRALPGGAGPQCEPAI